MERFLILLFPLLGMLRFTPPFNEFADEDDGSGPSGGDGYLLEDGTSYYILEGSGFYLKES